LGLFHALLLNGQLILGVDMTQAYNTAVLTDEAQQFTQRDGMTRHCAASGLERLGQTDFGIAELDGGHWCSNSLVTALLVQLEHGSKP